jgi:outer membrane lipoprotein-sorting protein
MRTIWMAGVLLAVAAVGAAQQDAKAFLKQAQQKYREAKSWEMKIDITVESTFGGNMQRQQSSSTIAMQRPNLVAAKVDASGFTPAREVYSDGKTVYMYAPSAKQYMKQAAPSDFRGANVGLLGDAGMLIALLEQDIDAMGQDVKVQFRGTQTIGGKQTRVVEVTEKRGNSTSNLKLYVGVQDRLVYRVEWNQTIRPQQSGQGGGQAQQSITIQATANIRYISFNKPIPASRFRFTPPKDAKEVQPPQQGQPITPSQPPSRGR